MWICHLDKRAGFAYTVMYVKNDPIHIREEETR